jgi:hypothetical protein
MVLVYFALRGHGPKLYVAACLGVGFCVVGAELTNYYYCFLLCMAALYAEKREAGLILAGLSAVTLIINFGFHYADPRPIAEQFTSPMWNLVTALRLGAIVLALIALTEKKREDLFVSAGVLAALSVVFTLSPGQSRELDQQYTAMSYASVLGMWVGFDRGRPARSRRRALAPLVGHRRAGRHVALHLERGRQQGLGRAHRRLGLRRAHLVPARPRALRRHPRRRSLWAPACRRARPRRGPVVPPREEEGQEALTLVLRALHLALSERTVAHTGHASAVAVGYVMAGRLLTQPFVAAALKHLSSGASVRAPHPPEGPTERSHP